jgi:exodeoxyribonuclease VII large subunit
VAHARSGLRRSTPRARLVRRQEELVYQRHRLGAATQGVLAHAGGRLALAAASLHAFSPLRTLERGYSIVKDAGTGRVIRRSAELAPGQEITGTLAEGGFDAVVSRRR